MNLKNIWMALFGVFYVDFDISKSILYSIRAAAGSDLQFAKRFFSSSNHWWLIDIYISIQIKLYLISKVDHHQPHKSKETTSINAHNLTSYKELKETIFLMQCMSSCQFINFCLTMTHRRISPFYNIRFQYSILWLNFHTST